MASATLACRGGPSWACRWRLVLGVHVVSASLLHPVGTQAPDSQVFPYMSGHYIQPAHTEVAGPKGTNKFWANWVVSSGAHQAIYPGPYSLRWASTAAGAPPDLRVSHGEATNVYGNAQTTGADRIEWYTTPFVGEFGLGTVESSGGQGHAIVREGLFGVWAAWRGPTGTSRQVTYPIFSGMTYVSALFEGGFTPRITSERAITTIHKVGDGIWRFVNNGGVDFRVYALTPAGEPVDGSFDFDAAGQLNGPLEGWIRLARVVEPGDEAVLDAHAGAVLTGVDLEVLAGGAVRYVFEKSGDSSTPVLHFAYRHHLALFAGVEQSEAVGLAPMRAPTKGHMHGVVGDAWSLAVDLSEVSGLGFLPGGEPEGSQVPFLAQEALGTLQWFLHNDNWKTALFKTSYYFSGKGFQKVAMICLLMEKFYGASDGQTQACAGILEAGFRCLYDPAYSGDCAGAPSGTYYDQDWGGIPSKDGYSSEGCMGWADFGNACYNDHHYHYGYFVVAGAVLVKLVPSMAADAAFVTYVEMLIRDTTNPSPLDAYFPAFRSFDWFDLHSWSRGVTPSAEGKDQESTSEELNLLYGIHLWGTVTGRAALRDLGQTMLALCAVTVREFFLLEAGNQNHPEDFVKNHVTGIFFQNKVHYTTWFGSEEKYIHGIQMLPLSPALQLTRKREFCQQEWDDIISGLPLSATDPWTSIMLTGTLAFIDPVDAFTRLAAMDPGHMDDGLTRAWALYWAASLSGGGAGLPTGTTIVPTTPETSTMEGSSASRITTTETGSTTNSASVTSSTTITSTSGSITSESSSASMASTTETGTLAPTHTLPPTTSPASSVDLCGHAATQCFHPGEIEAYLDMGCLPSGGLGCNAFGLACCRFCGAGSYASIPCPSSATPSPPPTPSAAAPALTPQPAPALRR